MAPETGLVVPGPAFARLLLAGLLLAGAAPTEEWPCARGDLFRTRGSRGPLEKPEVAWKREEKSTIGTGPALWGGMLVYGGGQDVLVVVRLEGRPRLTLLGPPRGVPANHGAVLEHDETLVDDLEQQTWLAALRRPPRTRSPRAWLGAVVRNLAGKEQPPKSA